MYGVPLWAALYSGSPCREQGKVCPQSPFMMLEAVWAQHLFQGELSVHRCFYRARESCQ